MPTTSSASGSTGAPGTSPFGKKNFTVEQARTRRLRRSFPSVVPLLKIAVSPRLEIRAGVHSPDRPMNASPFDLIVGTMIETKSILRYGVQVR
jgi:hypothetical protein